MFSGPPSFVLAPLQYRTTTALPLTYPRDAGYVRRPSAVGGKRGKPARLQRLIFEHGQRSKAGAGSGAGAFHFGDNGEDEGEDDAEEEAALLAEQMGLVDAGDDGGAAE